MHHTVQECPPVEHNKLIGWIELILLQLKYDRVSSRGPSLRPDLIGRGNQTLIQEELNLLSRIRAHFLAILGEV